MTAIPSTLTDNYNRIHNYMRISITDRCNLRCTYCMPEEGMTFLPNEQLMTDDEIVQIVRVAAKLGIRKIRLTGGEPLLRPNVVNLVQELSQVEGIEDLALTTNGLLLAKMAADLKKAGLKRVNISMDSLKPERFKQMTRGGNLERVLEAVERCTEVGLAPLKLNVVLMRGFNEDEWDDFIQYTIDHPITVRFIEYMPIGGRQQGWKRDFISLEERLKGSKWHDQAIPVDKPRHGGPAAYYRLPGAKGQFGLIHPVSDHFCDTCNRLRITADGYVKPCLYWSDEFHLRHHIGDDAKLAEVLIRSLEAKPLNHEMAYELSGQSLSHQPTTRTMSQIGG
nr:GTP 3',8-cyclase MoaA [Paenibacillus arenosi]